MSGLSKSKLIRIDLGLSKYEECRQLQKKLVSLRYQKKIPDCLIFTEHHPVITMGRGSVRENILVTHDELIKKGVGLVEVERGGDVTFHGPGQAVMYPIIDLSHVGRDTHLFLRNLEKIIIAALEPIGLKSRVKDGLTGVWVDDTKVAAIGVAVSRWITYHGIALNVTTDLNYFKLIIPCGIGHLRVGSIESLTGRRLELNFISDLLAEKFSRNFGYMIEKISNLPSLLEGNETLEP